MPGLCFPSGLVVRREKKGGRDGDGCSLLLRSSCVPLLSLSTRGSCRGVYPQACN